jgi:protein phosphatase
VTAFVAALCVVLGAAAGAMAWYARGSYFVGLQGNRLTVFQGRPGGLLWWRPTVAQHTQVTTGDVLPSHLPDLKSGKVEPSKQAAMRYVHNLVDEALAARQSIAGLTPPAGPPATTPPPSPTTSNGPAPATSRPQSGTTAP